MKDIFDVHGEVDSITLSTRGTPNGQRPPVQTRSALGIVKAAAEPDHHHYIAVMKPESVRMLIEQWKSRSENCRDDFYSLDPSVPLELDELEQDTIHVEPNQKVSDFIRNPDRSLTTVFPDKPELKLDDIQLEKALEHTRRFLLRVHSKSLARIA